MVVWNVALETQENKEDLCIFDLAVQIDFMFSLQNAISYKQIKRPMIG
jgi:hypothetical protein